jgi:para-nitrobenzyl esterase
MAMRAERNGRDMAASRVTKVLSYSLVVAAIGAAPAAQSQAPAIVRVDTGEQQGVVADDVLSFKGIPFAAPPVGELRWRPPQPAAQWTAVRQATEFGASCMQGRGFGPPPGAGARAGAPPAQGTAPAPAPAPPVAAPAGLAPSEDCLYLNVWRPADPAARNLPVMVWFYGGGFVGGSSSSPNTSGAGFAKQGVILVSLNYRVGRSASSRFRP